MLFFKQKRWRKKYNQPRFLAQIAMLGNYFNTEIYTVVVGYLDHIHPLYNGLCIYIDQTALEGVIQILKELR